MPTRRCLIAVLCGLVLTGVAAPYARATDVTTLVPGDALAYFGWSQMLDEQTEKTSLAVLDWALSQSDASDEVVIRQAVEMAVIAARASGGVAVFTDGSAETPDWLVAVVVDAGAESAGLSRRLEGLLRLADDMTVTRASVGGETFLQASDGDVRLIWGLRRDRLYALIGGPRTPAVAPRLFAETERLAENALLKECREKVGSRGTPSVCLFADLTTLHGHVRRMLQTGDTARAELIDAVARESGLATMQALYMEMTESDGQPQSRVFVKLDGPRTGLLKLWDQAALTDADLALIPADACWAMAANLDLNMLWQELLRVLDTVAPSAGVEVRKGVAMSQGVTGVSIPDDVLPALGDTWVVYDAPDHGGVLITGAVAVIDVRNADALQTAAGRLLRLARTVIDDSGPQVRAASVARGERTIHYLAITGAPVPVAPAVCFLEDRLVLGLSPQSVAVAVATIDAQAGGLLATPDGQRLRALLPAKLQSFYYVDERAVLRGLYRISHMMMTSIAALAHSDAFNPGLLPTLPEALADASYSVGGWTADEDGLLYVSQGSLTSALSITAPLAASTGVMVPSFMSARQQAQRVAALANLRGIGAACHVYADDHGEQFPPDFQALLDGNYIVPKQLESPRHPPGMVAMVYVPGQSMSHDVRNILAYEKPLDDEGVVALFIDGHVERMEPAEFRRALADTYTRLDRLDELPPEFRAE